MKGSITKRGKNRYLVRLFLGRDADGKQKRFVKTVHGTRKEAERLKREWIAQLEAGRLATAKETTLDDYMSEWFEVACKPSVEEATFQKYRANYYRYISPEIGFMQLGKLAPYTLQSLYHKIHERGVSVATIKLAHAPLSRALKQAVRWRKIAYNPAADVDLPRSRGRKREVSAMNPDQAQGFLDAAILTPWTTLWEVALSSGMRPGEYLGLEWDSVDWSAGAVVVRQAVKRPAGQEPFIGPPKTTASRRTIPLPQEVMEGLRDHRISQNEQRLKLGDRWNSKLNLVFPGPDGGIWNYLHFRDHAFKKTILRADLPYGKGGFTPYSLRHTCATLLLLEGENPKIVSERLGHASISETLDTYSHVLPTMQRGASDKLARVLFRSV